MKGWQRLGLVEEAVGAFERGNWRGNGSGPALVREKPMPVGSAVDNVSG
jgi:hypothetical protein